MGEQQPEVLAKEKVAGRMVNAKFAEKFGSFIENKRKFGAFIEENVTVWVFIEENLKSLGIY